VTFPIFFGGELFGADLALGQSTPVGAAPVGLVAMVSWPSVVDVGDTVTVVVEARTSDGTPGDVDTMLASVAVGGTSIDLTPHALSPGRWQAQFVASAAGTPVVAFLASGGVVGTGQVYADAVQVATVEGSFISVAQALAHLRASSIIVKHDDREQLRWLCRVACQAMERDLGRVIARRTITEEVDARGAVILNYSPVISLTSVAGDGAPMAGDTVRVDQHGILRTRTAWPSTAWGTITVTYVAGMDQAPAILQKVALNAVQRMWQTSQNSPHPAFGDAGGGGGAEFAATALMAAAGHLTPVEYGAYLSYRQSGVA
jgi:hypothetical protein